MKFSIAEQFTDTPGPRYKHQGKYSGEEFREKHLNGLFDKYKQTQKPIIIDLDGAYGYPTSFLEEAFGGLAREYSPQEVLNAFKFQSSEQPGVIEEITYYIKNAQKTRRLP